MNPLRLTESACSEEDVAAVLDVHREGWLTMGPRTLAFEEAFAAAIGAEHAVAVASGSAALHLALVAAGVGPSDEVLVPALAPGTAGAVRACGATPVPCDLTGPLDHTVDVAALRPGERTRAVIAIHPAGYSAPLGELEAFCAAHGLVLLEDAREAVLARDAGGRPAGTVGRAGCFSFSGGRQLVTGEGGMVVTGHAELAARVRSLRSHTMTSVTWDRHQGRAEGYDVLGIGFNFRLDEPRAALGLSRLARLPAELEERRAVVRAHRAGLAGLPGVVVPWSDEAVGRSAHHAFGVLLQDRATREAVRERLAAQGIETAVHAPPEVDLPVAAGVADRYLRLPLAATHGAGQVERLRLALTDPAGSAP